MSSSKLIIGGAQIGLNYGVSNKIGIPSDSELNKIIKTAKKNNITLLDTASSYGNAEQRIGNIANNEFNIITKISNISLDNSIAYQVKKSLDNLKSKSLYACLFHNANELIKMPVFWDKLIRQKELGLIKKIGYSLYHPEEFEKLIQVKCIPDIIQIPFNIIDRNFEPYLKDLKSLGIEIHVRSIFLQGLLLKKNKYKQKKFSNWFSIWDSYEFWLKKKSISPLEGCLSHVLSYKEFSNILVGIESNSQLSEIILASKKKAGKAPDSITSSDLSLTNPLAWM